MTISMDRGGSGVATGSTAPAPPGLTLADLLAGDPMAAEVRARWERWGPDLVQACNTVYPNTNLVERLEAIIAQGHAARPQGLRDRDRRRLLEPDWFQRPDVVGYVAYTDRFADDLVGVGRHIDYLRDLGVTYLHLLPLLNPRPGNSDGGYAVMDYNTIRPDLGTMADLARLADQLHDAGIALTLDLVLNHVAFEHDWALRARAGEARYREYFHTFPDRRGPDEYERTLRDVFPEFAPGNFTWDEQMSAWVWTTFNTWQWDLNWANPDVVCEFAEIVLNLANLGVDCLRLDAIVFLWKRLGSTCENQPEVHHITQLLRALARITAPSLIFKAEAIVAPRDVVPYLGVGEHAGNVSDVAYHNALMVQIWSALATRDARLLASSLNALPDIPVNTAWATYLRCHDDIGWAITDEEAAAVGWNGSSHRAFLSDFYVGEHPASFAEGATFQYNLLNGDRRVSGTAASLAGVGRADGIEALDVAIDRLLVGYAMVLGFGGIPLIYMGDEIGLLNDTTYVHDASHANDNRWLHRPKMPWALVESKDSAHAAAGAVQCGFRALLAARRSCPALHAAVPTRVAMTSAPEVVLFVRMHPAGNVVQVYNVADYPVSIPFSDVDRHVAGLRVDLISQGVVDDADGALVLRPYAHLWLASDDWVQSPRVQGD